MTAWSLKNRIGTGSACHVVLLVLVVHFLFSVAAVPVVNASTASPSLTNVSSITDRTSTPLRLATDSNGYIYVCDPRGGGILQYRSSGLFIQRIPTPSVPLGVAVDASGQLVVAMGTSAAFINPANYTVTLFPAPPSPFKMLNGVAVDPVSGKIYITDTIDNSVKIFDSAGNLIDSFNGVGTTAGVFRQPAGITYEKVSGNIAIVDSMNGRVVFFTAAKGYVKTVGSPGTGPLKFTAPQGVAFEYSGTGASTKLERMYVIDTFQSNIQAIGFDANNYPVFLRYIGNYPTANSYKIPGKLIVPADIAFDGFNTQSRKLVVSNGFGNLAVYGLDGGTTTAPQPGAPTLIVNTLPSATNISSIIVSGTTNASALKIENSGVVILDNTSFGGGSFSTSVPLNPGVNTITVIAGINPSTTVLAEVVFKTAGAPTTDLTLTSDLPPVTKNSSMTLAGTVTPASTVYVNGVAVVPVGNNWSHILTLTEGVNNITVSAGDAALALSTVLDTQSPTVYLAMKEGSTTSLPNISISGTVTDGYDVASGNLTIGIFDAPGTTQLTAYQTPLINGAFSVPVQLPSTAAAGEAFTIKVSLPDAAGNIATITRTLTYDPSAPVFAVNTADWTSYKTQTIVLTGTAPSGSTPTVARIDDNGAEIPGSSFIVVTQGESWTATGLLSQGANLVVATLGTSSVARNLVYEPSAPLLSLSIPHQDIGVVSTNGIYIKGAVSSGVGVSAVVYKDSTLLGTVPVTATSSGAFNISVGNALRSLTGMFAPPDGSYQFAVIASDISGNVSTAIRNIVIDSVKPVLSYAGGQFTIGAGDTLVVRSSSGQVNVTCVANVCTLDQPYDANTMNVFAVNSAGVSTRDGDINIDGVVDIRDLLMGIQVVVGILPLLDENEMFHGDVGPMRSGIPISNNRFTIEDLMLIMRKVVGIMW